MTRPLFAADSIGKAFGGRSVLRAATIWAHAGGVTAVFGRNGCGKSTMLKIAVGQVRADYGALHFDGDVLLRPALHRLAARGLFYLPERHLLVRGWSLARHLEAAHRRFGLHDASGVLRRLRLDALLDEVADRLSGGEQRKAELAIAICRNPRCLLADEPYAGLSPLDAGIVAEELTRLARRGCAVVITGHEVPQMLDVADDIIWMTGGTSHGLGSPAEARRHSQFQREYLGAWHVPPAPAG